jgi:hypothetical protein
VEEASFYFLFLFIFKCFVANFFQKKISAQYFLTLKKIAQNQTSQEQLQNHWHT